MARCCLSVTMKAKVKLFVFVATFLMVVAGAWFFSRDINKPPAPSHLKTSIVFQVDRSTTAKKFVHFLKTQNLIRCEICFLSQLRLRHLSTHLKAGFYQIHAGESAEDILQRVVRGEVMQARFTIVEGTTWLQIEAHLKQAPYLHFSSEDVAQIEKSDLQINIPSPVLEGLFLADTYQYVAGGSAKQMLQRAHQNLNDYLLKAWQNRATDLPYHSPYELLIVASILEKETALSTERHMISGVIVNRLLKHMPLQMDPTVIYGLGSRYTGILLHADLQDNSPYNTYRHQGLPPTPIAMVGRDAIDAAAHPEKTPNLYFVAKGDGTHVFSETYEAQRQAIQRYIRKK